MTSAILRIAVACLVLAFAVPALSATMSEVTALHDAKRYKEAFAAVKPLAEAGDVKAMVLLAAMYRDGQGTEESSGEARKWYGKAAEAGDAEAQYNYALVLIDEDAGTTDPAASAEWLAKAAGNGNDKAQYNLGLIYAGRYEIGRAHV